MINSIWQSAGVGRRLVSASRLWALALLVIGFSALSGCGQAPVDLTPPVGATSTGEADSTRQGETSTPAEPPTPDVPTATPEPFPGEGPWPLTFSTSDGITLSGTVYGTGTPAIILAPMYQADQTAWQSFAQTAAAQGFRVLTFDYRGYGSSSGERSPADAPSDLAAAVTFMRENEFGPLVLIGAGQGGSAAIRVAAQDQKFAGLVILSAPRSFQGLEVSDTDLAALSMPSLWLGTRLDLTHNVEEMYAVAAGSTKDMWIYEGSGLAGTFMFEGADAADLTRRLLEFATQVTGTAQ